MILQLHQCNSFEYNTITPDLKSKNIDRGVKISLPD